MKIEFSLGGYIAFVSCLAVFSGICSASSYLSGYNKGKKVQEVADLKAVENMFEECYKKSEE